MALANCIMPLNTDMNMDSDYEGFVLDCLAKVFFYQPQDFRYNSSQCNNLSHAFVAKLSPYYANTWRILRPSQGVRFTKIRFTSTSKLGQGDKKIMKRAWKEVYRVVKEAELYLKHCSADNWWIKSIILSSTGDSYAIHIHDLAWSVLCLHLNHLYSKGQIDDSYTLAACMKLGDFHAEMSNLTWIHDEYQDKRRLVTIFQELLRACEGSRVNDEDKRKVGIARFMSAKLQAAIRSEPAVIGSRVSPWLQIDPNDLVPKLRVIGQGSSAEVYEGSWLGVKVAVKEFPMLADHIDDELQLEIAVHSQLKSPFIVQLIGVCITEKYCYLVMELVSSSLDRILEDWPLLSLPVALDMMLQISRAMEYLHSQRIMHMDLKAANVLIQPSEVPEFKAQGYGRVKLCDFGHASLRLYSLRSPDFSKGTCYWRAPEVFKYPQEGFELEWGIVKEYTYKADVYSFAMTCYEILTGKQPFEGVDPRNVYRLIVQGERPSLPPSCPLLLANYIRRCWDKDPGRRPNFADVSNFFRYMKLLLMRVNDSCLLDSSSAKCQKIDVAQLFRCDEEQASDEIAVNLAEEGLIIRALNGDFPESFEPHPLSQQSAQPLSPKIKFFVSLPDYIQQYSYREVQNATMDFSRKVSGVSCLMWKGILSDGTHVSVKKQELEMSMEELSTLWQLHHPNVVRLRGVCAGNEAFLVNKAGNEAFLVYDDMVMGSMALQLFRPRSILNWNIRRKIGIGIARFLAYLHDDYGKRFLNFKVNCTNIFLDERFTPKFCGFLDERFTPKFRGFRSVNPIDMNNELLSASEQRNLELALQYEEYRNVQDFGIILLELLMGCKWENMKYSLQYITDLIQARGSEFIMSLLDRQLQGQLEEEEAMRWVMLALRCFARSPLRKPTMNKAVLVMKGLLDFSELPVSGSLRGLQPGQRMYVTSKESHNLAGMREIMAAWPLVQETRSAYIGV